MKFQRLATMPRLSGLWALCAFFAGCNIGLSVWFGLTWSTLVSAFVLGLAIGQIEAALHLQQKRRMAEQHNREIHALMAMNNAEIGRAFAEEMLRRQQMSDDDFERPTLQ